MIQQTNLYLSRYKTRRRGRNDIAVLTRTFVVVWNGVRVSVPRGFATDGSSVPSFARGIVDRMSGIEASVVHDFLYATQSQSKAFADNLFDAMLAENPDISWIQQNIMVAAVKVFGDNAYYKTETPAAGQEDLND